MTQYTQMTQNDTSDLGVGGNTSTPTRNPRGRNWCFTINFESKEILDKNFDTITQLFSSSGNKYILGKECGESKTHHIQGYVSFKSARTFSSMKKMLPRAHIEKAKGNLKSNFAYCSKEENYVTNIDLTPFKQKVKMKLNKRYENVIWKPWQQRIIDLVKTEPNERSIHWLWEETGNVGKSFLAKYLAINYDVIIADGKKNDIFNAINVMMEAEKLPKIVLLDVPRHNIEYLNYGAIESIKNGMIYSGKYEGGQCLFPPPHVIIMANCKPDLSKMSSDRWQIENINSSISPPLSGGE